ncbi:LuxR C-terminal-related transcriptional regulator [[Actinomadura] parvosata]|uniref:LuxR C-terminal-related transcriptional regulator n=1 Tax=[Actinomadura] parvosata TaxID=1955412 RepID=UPI00406CBD51
MSDAQPHIPDAPHRDQGTALWPITDAILGSEHPKTLARQARLANWTGNTAGDAAAARDQFAALLPRYERVLHPDHHDVLQTRYELARWTGEAGDPAAARDQLATLLPLYEHTMGAQHPGTVLVRYQLAHWTGEAGDPAAARDQLAALLPAYEQFFGAGHEAALVMRYHLARWTEKAGDTTAARDQLTALIPAIESMSTGPSGRARTSPASAERPPAASRTQGLTPREREIARLAASGMSNRQIAQELVLSARTVDNHLARVFSKLGISSREGLPAALSSDRPEV